MTVFKEIHLGQVTQKQSYGQQLQYVLVNKNNDWGARRLKSYNNHRALRPINLLVYILSSIDKIFSIDFLS